MNLTEHDKIIGALSRTLKSLAKKSKDCNDFDRLEALKKALKETETVRLEDLISELTNQKKELETTINSALESRREKLLKAAIAEKIPCKRFSDFDRVGIFKIIYKNRKVQLYLGSELFSDFEESDGEALLHIIRNAEKKLESEPFSRESFFKTLKRAYDFARICSKQQDGYVAIHVLYSCMIFARLSQADQFLQHSVGDIKPDYPITRFSYDMARFGKNGWIFENEKLHTMTPNMATIEAKKSLTLPVLDSIENTGQQLATLKIVKAGERE